jgi:DNA-binding NtrC family response regulator
VRELENRIREAVSKVRDREIIFSWDLQVVASQMLSTTVNGEGAKKNEEPAQEPPSMSRGNTPRTMSTIEKEKVLETLEATRGNITRAAQLLGYRSRQTMLNKMDKFGIRRNYGDPDSV